MGPIRWWIGMELARRRAAASADPDERRRALARAGDAYERGRATLRPVGAETPPPAWGERLARALGRMLARLLDPAPALRRRLEDRLLLEPAR